MKGLIVYAVLVFIAWFLIVFFLIPEFVLGFDPFVHKVVFKECLTTFVILYIGTMILIIKYWRK